MADLIVVGAGIVGASIAYHAARRGAAVMLVDGSSPASGATGASFAWIGDGPGGWPGGADDLRRDILDDYHRLESRVRGVHVRWTGSLSWSDATGPEGEDATDLGPDARLLGSAEVAALEPALRTPPDRAVHRPTDGAVDAARVTAALVRAARRHGAEVVVDTPVVSVDRQHGRVVGVTTADDRHTAAMVVLAAGTGTRALCAPLGIDVPVHPSPALLLHAETPPGMVRTVLDTPRFEARESGDGHVVMTAAPGDDTTAPALDRSARRAVEHLASMFVGGQDVRLLGRRLGLRPMPEDGAPILGEHPSVPGLYLAVMHSAICLAPTVGRLVAEEILAQRRVDQLARCRLDRFRGQG